MAPKPIKPKTLGTLEDIANLTGEITTGVTSGYSDFGLRPVDKILDSNYGETVKNEATTKALVLATEVETDVEDAGFSFLSESVKDSAVGVSPSTMDAMPDTAAWAILTPTARADAISAAFDYMGQYFGGDEMRQLQLYSLPPAQRALAFQQIKASGEFNQDFLNTMQEGPTEAVLQHFQTILTDVIERPAEVLGQETVDSLNNVIASWKNASDAEVFGVGIPVWSAIVGSILADDISITLTADQVRQHPG